jgi:hypothetical protein
MAEQREEAKRQFDADMGPALQELANLRLVLNDRAKGKKPVVGKKDAVQAGDAGAGQALQELANLRLVLDNRAKGKKSGLLGGQGPVAGKKDVVQAGAKEKKKKSALGGLFGKKK